MGEHALGVPVQPGLACVCAHDHEESFKWQRNFHVRGDLVKDESGWTLIPRKLVGGFELPPQGGLSRFVTNARKARRFRRIAKAEEARRI